MENVRLFFEEINNVAQNEKEYHKLEYNLYESCGNIDFNIDRKCRDAVFNKLATIQKDARIPYALEILRVFEVELSINDFFYTTVEYEEIRYKENLDSVGYLTIPKSIAENKKITGESITTETYLYKNTITNKYLYVSCLVSDVIWFFEDIHDIFLMFSINLFHISKKYDINIDFFEDRLNNKEKLLNYSHFNATYNKSELENIFNNLKGKYFHPESTLDSWLSICGIETTTDIGAKLNWIENQSLLGWMVYSIFINDRKNMWKITEEVFLIKGKKPNINSMKHS